MLVAVLVEVGNCSYGARLVVNVIKFALVLLDAFNVLCKGGGCVHGFDCYLLSVAEVESTLCVELGEFVDGVQVLIKAVGVIAAKTTEQLRRLVGWICGGCCSWHPGRKVKAEQKKKSYCTK